MAKFKAINLLFGRILKKKDRDSSFSSGGPRGWWRRRSTHNNKSAPSPRPWRSIGLIRVMSSFLKRKPRKCKANNEINEPSESGSICIHSSESVGSITSIESGDLSVQPNIDLEEVCVQHIQTKKQVTFQLQQLEPKEMKDDTISETSSLTTVTELSDYPWDDDISSELTSLTDDGCDMIATDDEFDGCNRESCDHLTIVKESVTKLLYSDECKNPSTSIETADDLIWKWITFISIYSVTVNVKLLFIIVANFVDYNILTIR